MRSDLMIKKEKQEEDECKNSDINNKCIEFKNKVEDKIREHPYTSIGIGLGVALFTGYILGRLTKCRRD